LMATSVKALISIPGAISIIQLDCPPTGRNPLETVEI